MLISRAPWCRQQLQASAALHRKLLGSPPSLFLGMEFSFIMDTLQGGCQQTYIRPITVS